MRVEDPELPSGFELVVRGGTAWIEYRLDRHRLIFSLRNAPGRFRQEAELDVGRTVTRLSPAEVEARSRLIRALGVDPDRVAVARQTHGDQILRLGADPPRAPGTGPFLGQEPPEAEADGLFLPAGRSQSAGVGLGVVTADCLSVALSGRDGLGLLHLGWRGLATGMLERAVEMAAARQAVIGPGVGPCCYSVGPEVFAALGIPGKTQADRLDLASVASERLLGAGVEKVVSTGLCTSCREELFFSHRRDGDRAGRQITMVIA